MPREKEDFREILARLTEKFPGRETISIQEAVPLVNRCAKSLRYDSDFPKKKIGNIWYVPIVGLARWLS